MVGMHAITVGRLCAQQRSIAPMRAHNTGIEHATGLGLGLGYLGHGMNLGVATWSQAVKVFLCRDTNFIVTT